MNRDLVLKSLSVLVSHRVQSSVTSSHAPPSPHYSPSHLSPAPTCKVQSCLTPLLLHTKSPTLKLTPETDPCRTVRPGSCFTKTLRTKIGSCPRSPSSCTHGPGNRPPVKVPVREGTEVLFSPSSLQSLSGLSKVVLRTRFTLPLLK